MANTCVEFQLYLKTDLCKTLMTNLVNSQVKKITLPETSSDVERYQQAVEQIANLFNVQNIYEIRYIVMDLGLTKEDSRLFDRRIDMIMNALKIENPDLVDIGYKILA